jgi:hypothetical protein
MGKEFAREIDHLFISYGYGEMVPPTARYLIIAGFCATPVILLFVLMLCCNDDYTSPDNYQPPKKQQQV